MTHRYTTRDEDKFSHTDSGRTLACPLQSKSIFFPSSKLLLAAGCALFLFSSPLFYCLSVVVFCISVFFQAFACRSRQQSRHASSHITQAWTISFGIRFQWLINEFHATCRVELCWLVSSIVYIFVNCPRQMTRGNPRGNSTLRLVLTKTQETAIIISAKREMFAQRGRNEKEIREKNKYLSHK